MSTVPVKASDVDRRLTGIWRFGLPPAMRGGTPLPYPAFLALLDCWINDRTGAAPSAGASNAAECSEQPAKDVAEARRPNEQEVRPDEPVDVDALRLRWIAQSGAYIGWNREGDMCSLWIPDDDECPAYTQFVDAQGRRHFDHYRDVIDAAMAKEKQP
jgi:hypothetical protein